MLFTSGVGSDGPDTSFGVLSLRSALISQALGVKTDRPHVM
jgi:hypothetical protein